MSGLRRKFKFSAERLSENAKTISLSPWKLIILQCVTNNGQEELKSLAKKPKNLSLSCSWCQICLHFAFKWCIFRLFIDLHTFVVKFLCRDLRTFFRRFFVTAKQTPHTFLLLECMYVAQEKGGGLVPPIGQCVNLSVSRSFIWTNGETGGVTGGVEMKTIFWKSMPVDSWNVDSGPVVGKVNQCASVLSFTIRIPELFLLPLQLKLAIWRWATSSALITGSAQRN